MIFETRSLVAFWLLVLAAAISLTSPLVGLGGVGLLVGLALLLGVVIWNLRGRSVKLNVRSFKLMAGCLLGAFGALAVLGLGLVLVASKTPVGIVLGGLILGGAVLYSFYVTARVLMVFTKSTAVMGYNIAFRGKKQFYEAVMASAQGRWQESLDGLDRYLLSHPNDAMAIAQRGWALSCVHRFEEAFREIERSLSIEVTSAGLSCKGQLLLVLGATEEALTHFDRALQMDPKAPHAYWVRIMRGLALIDLRRLGHAIASLQAADKGPLKWPATYVGLGGAYQLLGKSDDARKAYRQAVQRAKLLKSAEAIQASALAELGELEAAERAIEATLASDESNALALCALAVVQRKRGDPDGVEHALERLLPILPSAVVSALGGPEFTPLLAEERFRRLLGRALAVRDRMLAVLGVTPPPHRWA